MVPAGGLQEFRWPVRIYYEDTDAAGIVYHANYLRFMERARTEWLRQAGFEQTELAETFGVVFVVRKISIDYLRPARFNDEITVVSTVPRRGRARLEFAQYIEADGGILCRARVKVGCVDVQSMRPVAMPVEIYTEICNAS